MADNRIKAAANSILSALVTGLATAGIDVPTRQYIHSGEFSHDFAGAKCSDQLAVAWIGTLQGQIGAEGQVAIRCAMPLTHQFHILLLRCVPTLKVTSTGQTTLAPSAAELQDSGEEILTDAATLGSTIVDLVLAGNFVNSPVEDIVSIDSIESVGPFGGVGGSLASISVTLLGTP